MQTLRKGSSGIDVGRLQMALCHYYLGAEPLPITSVFNDKTYALTLRFQEQHRLVTDGIAGPNTWAALEAATANKFMVAVHGGHGGINPNTGQYATLPSTGKRYQHPGLNLHTTNGWFYEGVENRRAANGVAEGLRKHGIFALVTHHTYECDYGKLAIHRDLISPYLRNGYEGYTHAFHSNAISTDNSKAKLDATQGGYVYTTGGYTLSDEVAKYLLQLWQKRWDKWVRLANRDGKITTSSDMEANFQVLRQIEELALITKSKWAVILEEHGFMTSKIDCPAILEHLPERIECGVELGLWFRDNYKTFKV